MFKDYKMDTYLSYIEPLTTWLNHHPHWAGIFTFLVAFSESLAIIGSIVPGSITMTAIGMLIGTSVIPCLPTFAWAVLGAISGDSASYYLGYYYHERISEYWPFRSYPQMLESGKVFFKQHGGKSVFLGRFLGPLRSIIPMIAGMMRMPNQMFLCANITSAILWSLMYILPGILIGTAASELSPHLAGQLFVYTLMILCGIWVLTCLIKYSFFALKRFTNNHLQAFWLWMSKHPRLNTWATLISNPRNLHDHRQIALLLLALSSLAGFIIIAISAHQRGWIILYDKPIFNFLQSIRLPILDTIFMGFTFIADKKTLLPLLFIIFLYLVYRKKKWEAAHWLSNGIVSAILVYVLKPFINIPRPEGLVQIRYGASFPSGHTTFSVAIFGFLFYLIAKNTSSSIRRFIAIPGILLLTCIGFSRLYLGMHWLSDVIGSILIASSVLLLHILSYQRSDNKRINVRNIIFFTITIIVSINAFFMYKNFHSAIEGSQLKHTIQTSQLTLWWNGKEPLPSHRKNRFGIDVAPLNIQWVMPLNDIQQRFKKNGWHTENRNDISNRFKTLLQTKNNRISLFSKLYNNKPPKLLMTKGHKIIRLWRSSIYFRHSKLPLWIGAISYLNQERSPLLQKRISEQMKLQDNFIPSQMLAKELKGLDMKRLNDPKLKELLLIKKHTPLNELK